MAMSHKEGMRKLARPGKEKENKEKNSNFSDHHNRRLSFACSFQTENRQIHRKSVFKGKCSSRENLTTVSDDHKTKNLKKEPIQLKKKF